MGSSDARVGDAVIEAYRKRAAISVAPESGNCVEDRKSPRAASYVCPMATCVRWRRPAQYQRLGDIGQHQRCVEKSRKRANFPG